MTAWLAAGLALRDVRLPPAPSWWPPAPGWWGLGLLVGLVVLAWLGRAWRRFHHARALGREFDRHLAGTDDPAAQVMRMAELLRRAALAVDPATAGLHGPDWLAWLDGPRRQGFRQGAGKILLDGGYRRALAPEAAAALRPLARARYVTLRREAGK